MFPIRRAALRLLSSSSASFASRSRSITSFSSPVSRLARQSPSVAFQKRWATDEAEVKKDDTPISKLQPTPLEEVEAITQEETTIAAEPDESTQAPQAATDPPGAVDIANATEATDEVLAAEEAVDAAVEDHGAHRDSIYDTSASAPQVSKFAPKPTIYVGNLFFDVTEDDLEKEFARFGSIVRTRVIRDARGLSKGFAYVTFSETAQATKAISSLNQQLFEGRRLSVQFATSDSPPQPISDLRGPRNPPSKTLFIGNMSWEMTDRDLNNLFKGIRNVIDVRIAIDRRTGQPRGFAHADFIDVKSAMEARKMLEGKETYGRKLRIDYSYSSNAAPRNQARDEGASRS